MNGSALLVVGAGSWGGFYHWLKRSPSARKQEDGIISKSMTFKLVVWASF